MSAAHFPALVSAGRVARQTIRGALIWGAVFALVVWALVNEYGKEYPTAADRAGLVETIESSVGEQAIFGPAHHLDTVAAYTAYHAIGVLGIMAGIWGLVAATRLPRGEEDGGRWELLLAGPTTRRRAAAAALAGLGIGLLTLWAMTAAAYVVVGRDPDAGFSVGAGLFAAVATVATAVMFVAVGALCSQLAATRRQAVGLAAGAFALAYLVRAIAYSEPSLRWLHWASPLGWVDELRPLTDSRPLLLVPIVALTAALVALTIVAAGRRDLGAGHLPADESRASRTRFLNVVVTGLSAWIGAAISGAAVSLPTLLAAGVNVVPAGIFVLGIGTLVHGLAPRFAVAAAYGVVAWSFLVEFVGSSLGAGHWLLDLSLLHHLAGAPPDAVRGSSVAALIAIGIAAAVVGALAFARRDLKGA